MERAQQITDAITAVIKLMVDKPETVSVNLVIKDDGYMIEVEIPEEEAGRVIGQQGRSARSLRTLLSAMKSAAGIRSMGIEIN